jgi:acetyl esterase/lipase
MITYDELVATPPPRAAKRVSYGPGALQFGDLWLPAASSKRTTVVYLHGGCWQAEYSLEHASYAAAALAEAGYVVWTPEYRRLGDPGGGWPGTFDDVAAAVDFVAVLGKAEVTMDASRVILAGHSAGGQLALWAAARPVQARPIGVVGLAAITHLAAYGAASGSCNASVTPLMGGTPEQVGDRYRAVSPIERLPIGVPVRLVHGERDPIVSLEQAREFARRAKRAGDRVDVTAITGAGHFDLIAPHATAWASVLTAFEGISPPR